MEEEEGDKGEKEEEEEEGSVSRALVAIPVLRYLSRSHFGQSALFDAASRVPPPSFLYRNSCSLTSLFSLSSLSLSLSLSFAARFLLLPKLKGRAHTFVRGGTVGGGGGGEED